MNLNESQITPALIGSWLEIEREYVEEKFGKDQSPALRNYPLTHQSSFGGQASNRWHRLQQERHDGNFMRAAQMAAKLASGNLYLWATTRSLNSETDTQAHALGVNIATNFVEQENWLAAKGFINREDFYETPIGLGITYLSDFIRKHGLDRRSIRLGTLWRAADILKDSVSAMAVQFEETLASTGELPEPGHSSGNIEPWQ